ncbi:hypothetical protein OG568_04280 [Streptomyces sp. NBC_01450]|uniref:hypothetical protein n=1 Tax=Streptomyces sp. NBC_01450 TaxID=2903871 RepID=UPI002E346CCF|nr:hypothetical protein [Streptomyces sp. NBC_01450]
MGSSILRSEIADRRDLDVSSHITVTPAAAAATTSQPAARGPAVRVSRAAR